MFMSKNIASATKKRNWAFVLYPESAPENWRDILIQTGLDIAISPLHDRDKDPDGNPKKPHWHVILIYSGPTTFAVVKAITDSLCAPHPQALEAIKGYYRYLTHKDNPEKAQYDEKDIVCLNGFSPLEFLELSRSDVFRIKRAILDLIKEQGFIEYSSLLDHLNENGPVDHLEVAMNNTLVFDKYLTSRRHTAETSKAPKSMAGLAQEASD